VDAPEWAGAWTKTWAGGQDYVDECEGSFFELEGAFEKPDDAIPYQSEFVTQVNAFVAEATAATEAGRALVIEDLLNFLLEPEYAPFHRKYTAFRHMMRAKCVEFEKAADPRASTYLRSLCLRYRRLFPA
jgi:hypothetical protein